MCSLHEKLFDFRLTFKFEVSNSIHIDNSWQNIPWLSVENSHTKHCFWSSPHREMSEIRCTNPITVFCSAADAAKFLLFSSGTEYRNMASIFIQFSPVFYRIRTALLDMERTCSYKNLFSPLLIFQNKLDWIRFKMKDHQLSIIFMTNSADFLQI